MSSLADLFQSVIVPRSVGSRWRASAVIARFGWRFWRDSAMRIADQERREDTLAIFAPTFMVTLLIYWVVSQALGYGLLFWALRAGLRPEPGVFASIYFAGTSMLTIGYGDIVPLHWYTRALALVAAGGGLATFAVVATFLFQTFGAFQRREGFVVTISERTGAPPSGLEFIVRHLSADLTSDISPILRESQKWIAEVMETHLAYPVLTYFRSSHDDESWVGTLGALLDASTLLITTLELDNRGQAELTLRIGTHLVRDFRTSSACRRATPRPWSTTSSSPRTGRCASWARRCARSKTRGPRSPPSARNTPRRWTRWRAGGASRPRAGSATGRACACT